MTALPHEVKWLRACRMLAPLFSTCSRRQYFAVVLAPNKRVAGIGYNGAPAGMSHCVDGGCPRSSSTVTPGSAYDSPEGFCVAQHAEAGALLWSDPAVRRGGTLVVNGPPCLECARLIASSGVRRVVHLDDPGYTNWSAIEGFLAAAGVEVCGVTAGDVPVDDDTITVMSESGDEVVRFAGDEARWITDTAVKQFFSRLVVEHLSGRGD